MGKKRKVALRPRLDITTTLSKDDTKAIAVMALQETLLIDHLSFTKPGSDRARVIKGMMNLLNQLNKTYAGGVDENLIIFADRYLCRVQDAMDGFFDDMTEADEAAMEKTKAEWKVGMEAPCEPAESLCAA